MQHIPTGHKVRFTANRLGVLDPENSLRFDPDVIVEEGDIGYYKEPSRDGNANVGWHICTIQRVNTVYDVPVHEDQFELKPHKYD